MNSTLNRNFLRHKNTKQDGFNNLCTIIHQLGEAAQYQGEVYLKKQFLGSFTLIVTKDASNTEIHIDVSVFDPISQLNLSGAVIVNPTYQLQEKGYLVLYASGQQNGFHVILKQADTTGLVEVFDTRNLNKGDMVVLTPVYPGSYIVKNEEGGSLLGLTVKQHEKGKSPHPLTFNPVNVTLAESGFEPKNASVSQLQPLLINIQAAACISLKETT